MFNRQNLLIIGVVVAVLVAGSALWLSIRAGAWVEEATAIRTEIGSVDEEVVRTGAVIEGYRGRIDSLEVGLNSLVNELSGMSGRIDANWTQYNQQIADALVRLSELKSIVDSLNYDVTQINVNKTEIAKLQGGIENLRGDIEDIEKDIKKIKKELDLLGQDDYEDGEFIARYNTGNGFVTPPTWVKLYGSRWVGQQFETGSADVGVGVIRAYFGKGDGDPQTVTVEMYKVDSKGFPTGTVLDDDTVDAEDWSDAGKWRTFYMDGYELEGDTMYAVVFYCEDGNFANYVWIGVDKTGEYKNGVMIESSDGGGKWRETSGYDIGFEIIGVWD